ncbi:hypothetical protein Hte_009841 [Hypoxylon texense]
MAGQQSKEDLINFVSSSRSPEIEYCIQEVARSVLGTTTPLRIQWDLARCYVSRLLDDKPQVVKVATWEPLESLSDQREWRWRCRDDDAYVPCIRIEVSYEVKQNISALRRMSDILIRDINTDFPQLDRIPFRHDPFYSMFSVEFTTGLKEIDLNLPPGFWYRSRAVFLPVPETVYGELPTQYVMHNWKERDAFQRWVRKMERIERQIREAEREAEREAKRVRREERKRIKEEQMRGGEERMVMGGGRTIMMGRQQRMEEALRRMELEEARRMEDLQDYYHRRR